MIDNNAQCCWCGHDRGYHWTGMGCAGEAPYSPQRGTNEPCTCKKFDHCKTEETKLIVINEEWDIEITGSEVICTGKAVFKWEN